MKVGEAAVRQPFLGIAAAALLGITAADALPWPWLFGSLLVATALAFFVLRRHGIAGLILVASFFFASHAWRQASSPGVRLARELGEAAQATVARGEVVSEPTASANGTDSFLLRLESITRGSVTQPTHATVRAYWRGAVQFGDRLQLFGVAEPIGPPRNPGEFDYRTYLRRRDIHHSLVVRSPENGKLLARGGGNSILHAAHKSRRWMQAALARGLEDSPEVHGLISAMVLGLRDETSDEITEQFQQTGTLHLFAVSGLHVGIVGYLLWAVATALRIPRRWAAALVIPALFFYAAITGLNTSSLRAATMAALVLGGFFVERKVRPLNSLAAAAVLILCVDTNQLFSIGFQLSFAVVASIILFANPLLAVLLRWGEPDPFLPRSLLGPLRTLRLGAWRRIATGASVSLAAWAGSLFLILPYFYLITPVSLVANLLVVPLAFGILAVGMISLGFAAPIPWLGVVFNNANWALASAILGTVACLARAPVGHYYMELPPWPSGAQAEITALDLGAGAALHARSGGRDWLIDTGPERDFNRIVRSYLRFRGVNHLDGLVLTHADSLHMGAGIAIVRAFQPHQIFDTAGSDRSSAHQHFVDYLETRNTKSRLLSASSEFSLGRNLSARVLFPYLGNQKAKADDQALVLQLTVAGKWRVLLMSDSGPDTEAALLATADDFRSDILIKGQHGSGQSGSPAFLQRVAPQIIVATSADFPENERVRDDWAAAVEAQSIKLFRQDKTGAVRLRFWRTRWEAKPYLQPETFRSRGP